MTKSSSILAIAAALASLGPFAMIGTAFAQDANPNKVVLQAHGAALDVGSKHIVSYFTSESGICNVTLMIGTRADAEGEGATIGTRVKFAVPSGTTARTDTAEGKSLEIACKSGASSMSIRPVELMAYAGPVR